MSEPKITTEDFDRLTEIKEEMSELINEANRLLRRGPRQPYERARSYWLPHMLMALDTNHEYLGGSMCTMDETLAELRSFMFDEESEGEGE